MQVSGISIGKRIHWDYFTKGGAIIHSLVQYDCISVIRSNGDGGGWMEPKIRPRLHLSKAVKLSSLQPNVFNPGQKSFIGSVTLSEEC